jgi:hypothetical protein
MALTQRTLVVQTPGGPVRCAVVRVGSTRDPQAWVVILDSAEWLAEGRYPCTLLKDEQRTPGTVQIVPNRVDGQTVSFVQMQGIFRPDPTE